MFNTLSLSRVFTFGIGSGASTALVKGLAKAGNGTAEFIQEGERLQPKVGGWSCVCLVVGHIRLISCSVEYQGNEAGLVRGKLNKINVELSRASILCACTTIISQLKLDHPCLL